MPRYSRYSSSRNRNTGWERAQEHIASARRLSAELGGADKDVKAYFFSIPPLLLESILNDYARKYGSSARDYAAQTIPKWRSGKVKMSGMVAERLFDFLPPRMPLTTKYQLTESLWKHFGPSSKKRLRIGLDANLDAILDAVRAHIDEVVIHYRIPENLERRFNWLSAGDVGLKQQLLNHVRACEKALVVEAARAQIPVMLQHLSGPEGQHTKRLAQILLVGKHELELLLDKKSSGVALEAWTYISDRSSTEFPWGCLVPIAIIIGLYLLSLLGHH